MRQENKHNRFAKLGSRIGQYTTCPPPPLFLRGGGAAQLKKKSEPRTQIGKSELHVNMKRKKIREIPKSWQRLMDGWKLIITTELHHNCFVFFKNQKALMVVALMVLTNGWTGDWRVDTNPAHGLSKTEVVRNQRGLREPSQSALAKVTNILQYVKDLLVPVQRGTGQVNQRCCCRSVVQPFFLLTRISCGQFERCWSRPNQETL